MAANMVEKLSNLSINHTTSEMPAQLFNPIKLLEEIKIQQQQFQALQVSIQRSLSSHLS
jgi:hypothetical protein